MKLKIKNGNSVLSYTDDSVRDAQIGNLASLSTEKNNLVDAINEVATSVGWSDKYDGNIDDILNEPSMFIIILNQDGGFRITNWIGNVDGFIINFHYMTIAFNGWDPTVRPYYKLRWGANWSPWYQF